MNYTSNAISTNQRSAEDNLKTFRVADTNGKVRGHACCLLSFSLFLTSLNSFYAPKNNYLIGSNLF